MESFSSVGATDVSESSTLSIASTSLHPIRPSFSPQPSSSSASYPPTTPLPASLPAPEEDLATSTDAMDTGDALGPTSSEDMGKSRPYQCQVPDCGRWFKRTYTRNVHMLTHSRTKERKPFSCTVSGCEERFSRKHDRLRHEVGQHGQDSNWNCSECPRFFSSQVTLERHISEKHNG